MKPPRSFKCSNGSLKSLLIAGLRPAIGLQKLQIQQTVHTPGIVGCAAVFVMPGFIDQKRLLPDFHAGITAFVAACRYRIIQRDDYPVAKIERSSSDFEDIIFILNNSISNMGGTKSCRRKFIKLFNNLVQFSSPKYLY